MEDVMRIAILVILVLICSVTAASQQSSGEQGRSTECSKVKSVTKEKDGIIELKYKDVRTENVVKPNIEDYAGVYAVSDLGFVINLQVGRDGRIMANGLETNGSESRTFRLDSAKIQGGLLTATKIYHDGGAQKFEGLFMTRTVRNSPTDAGISLFGLGVPLTTSFEHGGITYDKLFYRRK